MRRFSGLMALVAFLSFSAFSTLAFADGDKKEEKKNKGGHVIVFGDEKKVEKKGMGGKEAGPRGRG